MHNFGWVSLDDGSLPPGCTETGGVGVTAMRWAQSLTLGSCGRPSMVLLLSHNAVLERRRQSLARKVEIG